MVRMLCTCGRDEVELGCDLCRYCHADYEEREGVNETLMDEMAAWQATRWMRLLDWIEAHTTGPGSWPWGMIWLKRGFAFHFASGSSGFALTFPLPRMLPGFVRPYQVQSLRTREGRRESDLHAMIPLYPPGLPSAYRTRRLRRRK